MSLNARMSEGDSRLYNPTRDVAHNFGSVMQLVADRLEYRRWDVLDAYLASKNVSMDDLGEACKAACIFVQTAADFKKERMEEALTRAGWWNLKPETQVAICAMMGTVMMGIYFVGVREATLGGVGPAMENKDLIAAGERAANLLSRSWLAKCWSRLKCRLSDILGALTGRPYVPSSRMQNFTQPPVVKDSEN